VPSDVQVVVEIEVTVSEKDAATNTFTAYVHDRTDLINCLASHEFKESETNEDDQLLSVSFDLAGI